MILEWKYLDFQQKILLGTAFKLVLAAILVSGCSENQPPTNEWTKLFNGKDLSGWTASENKGTFTVQDGSIVVEGDRSHLFYTGPIADANFTNFEFQAEVMTTPGSNSGIFFHTAYQEEGWPFQGYEAQVNSTHIGAGDYRELKKTGSLYAVRNIYKRLVPDDVWYLYHIQVVGDRIQIRINDMLVVDYLQPEPDSLGKAKYKGSGTFALQGHDPDSKVYFRNIRVKILDNETDDGQNPVIQNNSYAKVRELQGQQHSITDLRVEFHEQLNLDHLLDFYYRTGINIGVVLEVDELDQAASLRQYPIFVGGPSLEETTDMADIDYIIDTAGKFPDRQENAAGMDAYVESIVTDLTTKPMNVWSKATQLPENLKTNYQMWWNDNRASKVIEAAIVNEVAIEIDNSAQLPGLEFIKKAKELGAKFTYGQLGVNSEMGRLDYIVKAIEECGIDYKDIYIP